MGLLTPSRALLAAGLLTGGGACEAVIGADFDDVAPIETGSADSGAPDADSGKCALARPPPPPALTNSGGDADVWVIAKDVIFGEETTDKGTKPPSIGYDLDGLCANRGDPPPCQPQQGGDPTDGPKGEDNATCAMVGDQWSVLGQQDPPLTSAIATAGVKSGKFSPLLILRVLDWVAGYDDEQVTVEWYVALPANLAPSGAFAPKFDGSDTWPVLSKSTGSSEPLKFVDEKAYVTGRVLVARFPTAKIPLTTAFFDLQDAIVTGQLQLGQDGKWTLSGGMIAGITAADEMLRLMPKFTQALLGFPLCANISTYSQQIKPWVCASAEALLPGTPAGSGCNAMSVGVGFNGVEVKLGEAHTPPEPELCPPGADPAVDTCAPADGG
ncbi:MAG: hypothetical protein AMXMBFR56_45430 [Polyangiaceae bacterium]